MAPNKIGKILLFVSGGKIFAMDLGGIVSVSSGVKPTPIPRTPENLLGVVLHGSVSAPVYSVGPEAEDSDDTDMLIVFMDHPKGPIGVIADRIIGVIEEKDMVYNEAGKMKYKGESIEPADAECFVSNSFPGD